MRLTYGLHVKNFEYRNSLLQNERISGKLNKLLNEENPHTRYKGMVIFMEKSRQEKKELRRRQEDAALNRLLIWFGAAIVYEAVALLLKRFYLNIDGTNLAEINFASALFNVFQVLQFAAPVLTVLAVIWYLLSRRKGQRGRLPMVCAWVLAAVSVTAVASARFYDGGGVEALGVVAPVTAVLALIYYLYQKEFFCNTVLTGAGFIALLVYRRSYLNHPRMIYFGFALVWIGLAAAVVLAWKLSQTNGRWNKRQIFSSKTSYVPTYLTAAFTALTLVAALAFGSTVAYYAIFALVTWLFCLAVYYTVRMM